MMRLPARSALPFPLHELPLWPPLLATRGAGSQSSAHSHHAIHLLVCTSGELRVRAGSRAWRRAAGVLTAPDVPHEIDARGSEVLLVFVDPESDAGEALRAVIDGPLRLISDEERTLLTRDARPEAILREGGVTWTRGAVATLGGAPLTATRLVHPRVRKLLKLLRATPDAETSLEALASAVGLSPSRLMHAFTTSIGLPLRPYLSWLKLQRAAAAIVSGLPLADAAHAAGFADAAHMSRTFRRMFGMPPSSLRPYANEIAS